MFDWERCREFNLFGKHFFFHGQNLKDGHHAMPSPPTEGRCWLRVSKNENSRPDLALHMSWALGTKFCYVRCGTDPHDDGYEFSFAVPFVGALWFSAATKGVHKLDHKEWEVGYRMDDHRLVWRFGRDPHSWDSKTPKWKDGGIYVLDALLGPEKMATMVLEKREVLIPLPEGPRKAVAVLSEQAYKRKRWPFPKYFRRVNIEPEKPAAIPGKGENSWDCGDDAIYSQSSCAYSIEEGVAHFIRSVLETRWKRAGSYTYGEEK